MKYLHLTGAILLTAYLATMLNSNTLDYSTRYYSMVDISVDWQNPTNRSHPEAFEIKTYSTRKLARLYSMNLKAAEQYKKLGFIQTKGRVDNIISNHQYLIFKIKDGDKTVEKKLIIYVKPPQKLIIHN